MKVAAVPLPFAQDYRKAVSVKCRELLNDIVKPSVAVRYVVALGKRDLLWDLLARIDAVMPPGVPRNIVTTLIAYYAVNRRTDTDWVVLPVANFDVYFGSTMFSRKHMGKLPKEIIERSEHGFGVSRYRVPEK